MMRRALVLIRALAAAVIACNASAADLLDVYRMAQQQDPVFEAARQALESVREKLPQARAGLLPVVAVNGGSSRSQGQYLFGAGPEEDRNINAWNWALQLTQPVFRVQNWEAYTQAAAIVEQAEAQFAQAGQDLILRAVQAYFEFDVAQESIRVADAQLRAIEQQLNLARRGFNAGTNPITDVHEAKSRFDLARAQRVAAQNELEARRSELERIIGTLPEAVNSLDAHAVPALPEPRDVEAWIANARENAPAVRGQRAAVEVAEREIAKTRAGHLPTLDMTASYGSNYASGNSNLAADYGSRIKSGQIGLQLSIPIYSGGAVDSRVTESMAALYKARAELEAARRQAGSTARQAFAGVANGISQIEALVSAVDSSISSVKANQVGYRLGTRINIDVLNAEQQLYTAKRDLIKARYETLLHGLKLKASTGGLTDADVVAINRWFRAGNSAPSAQSEVSPGFKPGMPTR
jgi:outer membrane protein